MEKIFKYELAVLEKQTLILPACAKIIRVSDVDGKFYLWAIVNTDENHPKAEYKIEMYKTGQPIENSDGLEFLGLCKLHVMMELGLYTFLRKA